MADWYNSSWRYRKKVTIPAANVAGSDAMPGFPLLHLPREDADIVAHSQLSGHDIFYTAADGVTKLPHELRCDTQFVSRTGAYSYYGGHTHVYHEGVNERLFTGVILNGGSQVVTQWDYDTETLTTTEIGQYDSGYDEHSAPTLLVRSSDSKLIVAREASHSAQMFLRTSTNAEDATAWEDQREFDPDDRVGNNYRGYSYPTLLETSDGTIWLFYRLRTQISPTLEVWKYCTSSDDGDTWSAPVALHVLDGSGWGSRPYFKFSESNGTRIDLLCSSDTPGQDSSDEFLVKHAYHFDGAWRTTDGSLIGAGPWTVSQLTSVYDGTAGGDSVWVTDEPILDSVGNPRVVFYVYEDDVITSHLLHYGIWNGSAWSTQLVTDEGGQPTANNGYPCGAAIDPLQPDYLFVGRDEGQDWSGGNITEIQLWRRNGGSWAKLQDCTTNSTHPHWRPRIAKNCPAGKLGRVTFTTPTSYTVFTNWVASTNYYPAIKSNFARAYIKADIHGANATDIYCYFDNSQATDQQDINAVWSDYAAVYPTTEPYGFPPSSFRDSSGNKSTITYTTNQGEDAGNAGPSQEFSTTGWTPGTIDFASQVAGSIECYFKYDSSGSDEHTLLGTGDLSGATAQLHMRLEPTDDTVEAFATIDTNQFKGGTVSDLTAPVDTWAYAFIGWSAAAGLRSRVNQSEGAVASSTGTAFDATSSPFFYVGRRSNGLDVLQGNLAEIRALTDIYLSKDWTDTQVNNWGDGNDFFAVGDLEIRPGAPLIGGRLVGRQLVNNQLVDFPLVGVVN